MIGILASALAVALSPAASANSHQVSVPHASGAVDATYRTSTDINYRQVGAATKPGVASTLRCQWSATAAVSRDAQRADGTRLSRAWAPGTVLSGTRPGWCDNARKSIAEEVAARADEITRHRLAVAAQDQPTLIAELEGNARAMGG